MLITSKDNARIKHARKLLNKRDSISEGLFLIEGENLIDEAIKNNLLTELFVLENVKNKYNFECNYVSIDVMKSMSSLSSTPRMIGISKFINKTDDILFLFKRIINLKKNYKYMLLLLKIKNTK